MAWPREWLSLLVIPLIFAAGFGAGLLFWRHKHPLSTAPERNEPARLDGAGWTVETVRVEEREAQEFAEFPGTVQSRLPVEISTRFVAQIREITVHSGQPVKKGQVLVRLDDRDIQTRIRQAEATAEAAEATVRSAGAAVTAAQALREEAERDLARYQEMFKAGAAPLQQLQQMEARFKTAAAALDGAREQGVAAARQAAAARAQLGEVKVALDYAELLSPMDAIVVERRAQPGDLAAPGRALLTLHSHYDLRFEAPISESCARQFRIGMPLRVRVDAADVDVETSLSEVVPIVDPQSRSFLARASLEPRPSLRPGMFGRFQVPCALRRTLAVPRAALLQQGQLDCLVVVEEGRARWRLVQPGRVQGEWAEILSGVKAGEEVVAAPLEGLRDGDRVSAAPRGGR